MMGMKPERSIENHKCRYMIKQVLKFLTPDGKKKMKRE